MTMKVDGPALSPPLNHVLRLHSPTTFIVSGQVEVAMNIESQPSSIDVYIASFPDEVQAILTKIRSIIKEAAPDAQEAIKYQIPTFVLGGNLVHFAAFARHIGFYPTPSGILKFQAELADYQTAKGSVQFPLDLPIPYELIRNMVQFRVSENQAKIALKAATTRKRNRGSASRSDSP